MSSRSEFILTVRRAIRVLPTLSVLALAGFLCAYLVGVPLDLIAGVVAVPLIVMFFITRFLLLAIPDPPDGRYSGQEPSGPVLVLVSVFAVSMFVGVSVLLSAVAYHAIGFGADIVA